MSDESIDNLRTRLRDLGYLDRGVGRLFSADVISTRSTAAELLVVALKGSALIAPPIALLSLGVMVLRNGALSAAPLAVLPLIYLVGALIASGLTDRKPVRMCPPLKWQ